jgi:hypothetical protein
LRTSQRRAPDSPRTARRTAEALAALAALALAGPPAWSANPERDPEPAYTIVTERGDTLIGISEKYLESTKDWGKLQKLNKVREPRKMKTALPLKIPLKLMRTDPVPAKVVEVQGEAKSAAAPIETGDRVRTGNQITTGDDSYVTLELPDGSQLRVQAQSQVALDRLRN